MTFSAPKKQKGDLLKSEDWNALMAEVERLANEKLDRNKTDTLSGSLKITESLEITEGLTVDKDFEIKGKLSVSDANQKMEVKGNLIVSKTLEVEDELKMGKGIIRRGGEQDNNITNTQDLGLYSQLDKNAIRVVTNQGDIRFFTDSNSGGDWDKAKLTIKPDGKVGIGNTNPSETLEVKGTIKAESITPKSIKAESITAESIVGKGAFVVGMIIMWNGNENNIPQGWVLCDGNNGTPDLRKRFIMGAGDGISPKDKGDPDSHNHIIDVPSGKGTTNSAGSHNHKFPSAWYPRGLDDGKWSGIDAGSTDPRNVTTQDSGEHSHSVTINAYQISSQAYTGENRPRWYALCFIMYKG